jgi:hypothetical protein
MPPSEHRVADHFEGRAESVRSTYDAILRAAKKFGPVEEDPKKTSIHLNRKSAFAGIATRKAVLVLTLKSDADIKSARIAKREKVSAKRWHLELKLESPRDVDRELVGWLKNAYEMSG